MSTHAGWKGGSVAARSVGCAVALASTLMLGACGQIGDLNLYGKAATEEPAPVASASPVAELEKATEYWGKESAKNPQDGKAALSYARNLKALGRKPEALAVLQGAYLFNSNDREYLSEYGRLALEAGQVTTAGQLLERADDPAKPDWKVVSARGTVLAKQGQYKEAIAFFERARELAPTQASVLNNLAMAYTMDGQANKAEGMLRQAADMPSSDPKVKQNLALVLGLQGKSSEAASLAGPTEPGHEAAGAEPAIAAVAQGPAPKPMPVKAAAPVQARTAPVEPVESAPLDPEAIIKAATEAEAAKSQPPAAAVTTGSAPKPKAKTATKPRADQDVALRSSVR